MRVLIVVRIAPSIVHPLEGFENDKLVDVVRFKNVINMPFPPHVGMEIQINPFGDSFVVASVVFDPYATDCQYKVYFNWDVLSKKEYESAIKLFHSDWVKA